MIKRYPVEVRMSKGYRADTLLYSKDGIPTAAIYIAWIGSNPNYPPLLIIQTPDNQVIFGFLGQNDDPSIPEMFPLGNKDIVGIEWNKDLKVWEAFNITRILEDYQRIQREIEDQEWDQQVLKAALVDIKNMPNIQRLQTEVGIFHLSPLLKESLWHLDPNNWKK